ncbi:MAG TPA: outer membrane protein transport protein [Thermoanaerobaculia bacterium]|nr:outer membrane protein transport protein [Thermoanaerobaculia bacterium]HSN85357.1 outer membrane protein transport protein [Thermoanaerobaculia bacterium]
MQRGRGFAWRALGTAALGALLAVPTFGAGFSIFEQGTKAMGMAGAFTAQADDPSLLYHNAGGLAFVTEREISAGFTWITSTEAELEGANPFPGEGYRAEQEDLSEFPPHLYWVQPINETWKFGLGITAPFGLTTEWANPDQFAGRFLSTKAALRSVDINPTIGWQITPSFGLGFGAIARVSDVELNRNVPTINPFTQQVADVGRLALEADFSEGYGFNAGILHKFNNSFSWGLSYRSKIKVEYDGDARLTQVLTGNPQFDAVIASRLPFNRDLPVETEIEFPDQASLGLAFALSPSLLLETDFNWMGWSTFDEVPIDFVGGATNSLPDQTLPQEWDDANSYRAGLRWTASPTSQWRVGYVFDETPQPEEGVSPLLPDADRNGFTLGYGYTGNWKADFAIMYLPFDERTRDESRPGEGPFFGTYNTTALLFGATLSF